MVRSSVASVPGTAHLFFHVEARDERRATKLADRVAAAFHNRLNVTKVERYWKIEDQWVIAGSLELEAQSLADATVEMLRLASALAHRWDVDCPEEGPDGSWHFDGYATGHLRVSGVVFAHWTLSPISS